jgi:phosphotransacetylase
VGIGAPVHILQPGVEVNDIVNMAALCVLKGQRFRHDWRVANR